MIFKHIDKNNLHHAYLVEGLQEGVLPEIIDLVKNLGVETIANPDFCHIQLDSLKVEDARNLKSFSNDKAMSTSKKIFIISANNILLEAQNTLLKMFEEPIENTHFFLIIPDANVLIPTFISRFFLIKTSKDSKKKEAEGFIASSIKDRIDFIKELLSEAEEEEEILSSDSPRSKALNFLNALEVSLHSKFLKSQSSSLGVCLKHFFKVRKFLRQPGSSAKSLMESVAVCSASTSLALAARREALMHNEPAPERKFRAHVILSIDGQDVGRLNGEIQISCDVTKEIRDLNPHETALPVLPVRVVGPDEVLVQLPDGRTAVLKFVSSTVQPILN
ncbi:hypothetical protein K8Q98_01010 [Candidatus Nomurabacteria bacterium]|nr:hypothetical protein [Candidatus Nomurabacteria bacterium]